MLFLNAILLELAVSSDRRDGPSDLQHFSEHNSNLRVLDCTFVYSFADNVRFFLARLAGVKGSMIVSVDAIVEETEVNLSKRLSELVTSRDSE